MRAWAPEHEEPAEKDTVRDDTGRTDADGLEPFIRGESYIETGQEARAERRTPVGTAYAREPERMETREEKRENLRKKDKPQKAAPKDSGKKASSKAAAGSGPNKKEVRLEQKEKKLRDSRMRDLESEVERLTVQERLRERR